MIGIYKITNLINNKSYIGKSLDIEHRFREHKAGIRSNIHLQNSIKKYGIENFDFSIIEECDRDECSLRERYWIEFYDSFRSGYNSTTGGENEPGWHLSEDSKDKLRVKKSEETKRKMSESLIGNTRMKDFCSTAYGHEKISNSAREAWKSESVRLHHNEANVNRWSKASEHEKHSKSQKDRWSNESEIERQRNNMIGNTYGKGRIWIHKPSVETRMIYPYELDTYLSNGWLRGRGKIHSATTIESVTDEKYISE